jgi:CheY-like chemotaxis protein
MTLHRPNRVLLIDDEVPAGEGPGDFDAQTTPYMWFYALELREAGIDVVEVNNVEEALRVLTGVGSFDLVVLDVMMCGGRAFSDDETEGGLQTGVLMSDAIAKARPGLPIIVLTNQGNLATLELLKMRTHIRDILPKLDYPPEMFLEVVKKVLWNSEFLQWF